MKAPCPTCPWRMSSTAGGEDIPGFDLDLMRGLRSTVGLEDDFRPMMACHYSRDGDEHPCVGYIVQEGMKNLSVRVGIIRDEIDYPGMVEACEGIDLWPSFEEMLRAYEEAS